jgi:hypothetical protein
VADEISGDLGIFPLGHVPGHDVAAPDIDHQIEASQTPRTLVGRSGMSLLQI